MKSKITATILGAALILGTGQAAAARPADDVEVLVPPDITTTDPWLIVGDYELTDGALYFTVPTSFDDGKPGASVWRRDLLPTADGVALGNAYNVGTTRVSNWDAGMAAVGDGLLFTAIAQGGKLVRLGDDALVTPLSETGMLPVESASASWFTTNDELWPVPVGRAGATGGYLNDRADAWDTLPWDPEQTTSWNLDTAVSETVVAWIERLKENDGDGSAIRVYANLIDENGFVGDPVLLTSNDNPGAGDVVPFGGLTVSDEAIAWAAGSWTEDGIDEAEVQWVSVEDLSAEPTVVTDAAAPDLDGSNLGYVVLTDGSGDTVEILDTTTGDVVSSWTTENAWDLELNGDLAAVGVMVGGREGVQLHSISGDTEVTAVPQFTDIAWSPFVRQIDAIALAGITTGYPDGTFRPMASVTREAMAAFLYRQAGEPAFTPPATSPFTDVTTGHPFYAEICWLASEGISTGWTMANGTKQYRPGQPVSREAMAAFLYRFAGEPDVAATSTGFVDVSSGHPFADAITWLSEEGVSTGWSTPAGAQFKPGASIERQAMAAFLVRYEDATSK